MLLFSVAELVVTSEENMIEYDHDRNLFLINENLKGWVGLHPYTSRPQNAHFSNSFGLKMARSFCLIV